MSSRAPPSATEDLDAVPTMRRAGEAVPDEDLNIPSDREDMFGDEMSSIAPEDEMEVMLLDDEGNPMYDDFDGEAPALNVSAEDEAALAEGLTNDLYFHGHRRPELKEDEEEDANRPYLPELFGKSASETIRGADGEELKGEWKLEVSNAGYEMLHRLQSEYSCQSFDFVSDHLGPRTEFPRTAFFVSGSQAPPGEDNFVYCLKAHRMCRTRYDDAPADVVVADDAVDEDPMFGVVRLRCPAVTNRVRVCHEVGFEGIVAFTLENGQVLIFDLAKELLDLGVQSMPNEATLRSQRRVTARKDNRTGVLTKQPSFMKRMDEEGYALAWSIQEPGLLASGSCGGRIYMHSFKDRNTWDQRSEILNGHDGASVEDIAFAPASVPVGGFAMASVGCDGRLALWHRDTRTTLAARVALWEDVDCNVLSWSKHNPNHIAVGGDNGEWKLIDLSRVVLGDDVNSAAVAETYAFGTAPVTSIDWCPTEDGVLAVAYADQEDETATSVAIWDINITGNDEDVDPNAAELFSDVPPQLLFVHRGQAVISEVHWHPQIRSTLGTTACDGFNIFSLQDECLG